MTKLPALLALALLAACAGQPIGPSTVPPPVAVTPQQADARTRADLHTQLGAGYYELRSYAVALEELNEALRADASHGPAYNMLGLVYMELKEDAAAEQNFQRALALNALDSDANNNYGWFLCQRKRYDEGIQRFMAAVKNPLYQNPEKSWFNAGMCTLSRGDESAAAQYFQRALELDASHPQALFQLATLAYRRGEMKAAKGYLARLARTGAMFSAEALWLALRVERNLGDREAEASYGLQLRRNYPNSREAQALLNRQYE